jgi:hypothetical protein
LIAEKGFEVPEELVRDGKVTLEAYETVYTPASGAD